MFNRTIVVKKDSYFFLIIFACIVIITSIDIVRDLHEGLPLGHVLHEMGIAFLCLILSLYQFKIIRSKSEKLKHIQNDFAQIHEENNQIKLQLKKLSGDFHQIINLQMEQWKFSESEKDIGKLIMKGLNMTEIAQIRQTSESTVRQQATSLYRKANVHNRQEFISYFLEDL